MVFSEFAQNTPATCFPNVEAAGDIAPVDGAFALRVTDGEITALSYGFDVGANRVPFGQFLERSTPGMPLAPPGLMAHVRSGTTREQTPNG